MYREVLHTRFRTAPTGPMHLGHVIPAYLSMVVAKVTGGTFLLRIQSLKAQCCKDRWERYRIFAQPCMEEMIELGLKPSDPETFAKNNMDPSWAVQFFESKEIVDYWYKELGLEAQFGKWEVTKNPEDPQYWKRIIFGNYETGFEHPYIVLTQVALDMACGRNCLIRGDDHRIGASLAHEYAQRIAMKKYKLKEPDAVYDYVPSFHFVPRVKRSGTMLPPGARRPYGISLASSMATTEGFYVRDILNARVTFEALAEFIENQIFIDPKVGHEMLHAVPGEVGLRTYGAGGYGVAIPSPPSVQRRWGVVKMMEYLKTEIIIQDTDWFGFLQNAPKKEIPKESKEGVS